MFDELRPHLVELRKRLAISAASLIVMFFVMFYFHEPILTWMVQPLNDALTEVGKVSVNAANGMITTSQVGGAFFVALKVSFFAAILGALPIILSQIWFFIAPGLYAHEKKMVFPFVAGGTIMFLVGVLFAYYVVTPFGFDFLITFGSFKFTPLINIEDYVGFFTKIMFGFGLAFELPVFAYFLALLGLVDDRQMTSFFKYAIVIIFIVAALLTPPDVLTQLLMAGPLVILYLLSILIVKMVNPAAPIEDEENEDEDEEEDENNLKVEHHEDYDELVDDGKKGE
ncbi:twin-arginine translocase subunit TatC [Sulfurimonas autotrophica]|uniref:Sec-independent protein translocase protein TatC n=1 Tax=Sulfurimonas autotrophica (strain ATCC BAA-671 / DSM 16294 / JCM 11897 / OK10) TaxID=563040 RepID=E0UPU1_SULAO|nr:twin-arginine translocase subunit TatC [Sulfurimonas autotrophica]ADN09750.1 Sec-independent protein translocase TatC [Sulfurimonas autotrophica DSM 16294]